MSIDREILDTLEEIKRMVRETEASIITAGRIRTSTLSEISPNAGVIGSGSLNSQQDDSVVVDLDNKSISIQDSTFGNSGVQIQYNSGSPRLYVGDGASEYLRYEGGALTISGSITADSGSIGGWTIGATTLSSGSISLNSATPAILIGSATDYITGAGIFMGLSGGAYKMHVGDPAGKYWAWDGASALSASGNWIGAAGVDFTLPTISGLTLTDNSPSGGSVAWSAFTLTYQGVSYSVTAGNTSNKYIYWKKSVSTTVLQTSAAAPAQAADTFLIAVNNSGTSIQANFFNIVYADYISVTNLAAVSATMGALTVDNKLTMSGASSAIAIGTTPPTSSYAGTGIWIDSSGIYGLNSDSQEFVWDAATGTGIFAGGAGVLSTSGITLTGLLLAFHAQATSNGITVDYWQGMTSDGSNAPDYLMRYQGQDAGSELITNGDGSSGDTTGWSATTGVVAYVASGGYSGAYLKVSASTSPVAAKSSSRFAVTAGYIYNAIAATRVTASGSADNENIAGTITLTIKYYDASSGGTLKGTNTIVSRSFSGKIQDSPYYAGFQYIGGWLLQAITCTAPTGATHAEVNIDASLTTTPAHLTTFRAEWDNVSFAQASINSAITQRYDGRISAENNIGGKLSEYLYIDTALHTVNATTNETDMATYTLPANLMYVNSVNRGVRVRLAVDFINGASGSTRTNTVKLYWGGSLIHTWQTTPLAVNKHAVIYAEWVIMGYGATNAQRSFVFIDRGGDSADGTATVSRSASDLLSGVNAATVDTTSTAVLKFSVTHSNNNAAITSEMRYFTVEYL